MDMLTFENYIKSIDLQRFLEELGASNVETIVEGVKHFTEREGERRDQIVLNYSGEEGVRHITESIVDRLLSPPKLVEKAKILDVGAGSGLFTVRVLDEMHRHMPRVSFYAMDATPTMLRVLRRKTGKIMPFLGIAENIVGSLEYARRYLEVPRRFNAVFSTLTLHHCLNVEKVFESIRAVLEDYGKAILIDLCEHPFEEFREEMGNIHLGFNPSSIEEYARKFFPNVYVQRIPGICCESSGRSAELFTAYLTCK